MNRNQESDRNHTKSAKSNSANKGNDVGTRAYLEQTVVQTVTQGMALLAKERPTNPLEWLGNYILRQAHK